MLWRSDTIAAVSTPIAEGGIGIIRISGTQSLNIMKKIFVSVNKNMANAEIEQRRIYNGFIKDCKTGKIIDEVVFFYMKAPHSYTCEDVAEIQCHGSVVSVRKILNLVLSCGAVMAEPGEFTLRAFLNGRIDLSQAEAVIDIIKSKTDRAGEAAVAQLNGVLADQVSKLREELDEIIIKLIANIEYPEEDIEEYDKNDLIIDLEETYSKITGLSKTADTGKIIREGLRVSLIGRPNAGKSSIMNALLKEQRAIVTDIPGTTRDVIEESLNIDGIPIVVSDTAGIRSTNDVIEKIGINKSIESIINADLIFLIIDSSEFLNDEDYEIIQQLKKYEKKYIIIMNKSDLEQKIYEEDLKTICPNKEIIHTSIKSDIGVKDIENIISQKVKTGEAVASDNEILCNLRHKMILDKSAEFIRDALSSLNSGYAYDFAESDVREARELLGEIIGESVDDDIIKKVFSRFCLGK